MSATDASRVLVIDDDAVIRVTVQDYLAEAGFMVLEASTGEDGLQMFQQYKADLVLLDVTMPGMDGFAVCQALRAAPGGGHLPIVMLTGQEDAECVERAYAMGATDFVTKPLNCPLLVHRLHYLLRAQQTSDALRKSREQLAHAQRIARLGSWSLEVSTGRLHHCAQAGSIVLGRPQTNVLSPGQFRRAVAAEDRAKLMRLYRRAVEKGQPCDKTFRLKQSDGTERVVQLECEARRNENGNVDRLYGTVQDITERHRAQARIRELAYFDPVTGLPNRTLFTEQLDQALEAAKRDRQPTAVVYIDLDHFKLVNDTWGHDTGDTLLRQVAERLDSCLNQCEIHRGETAGRKAGRPSATLARLGGDEFVVMLTDLPAASQAGRVAQALLDVLAAPFVVENTSLYVSASIGISVSPDDGDDVATLLKRADMAMYTIKREGRHGVGWFTPAMQAHAAWRLNIETRMRHGLENGEFTIHYQPLVAAGDERLHGLEALVRWNDPEHGLVSPVEFIPVAEETGLIVPLGDWVLENACLDLQRLHERTGLQPSVAVNLSAAQLRHPELLQTVRAALAAARLDAEFLELEITESMLMVNAEESLKLLQSLRDIGISLSIDDFGTGYSSLSYMKQLPIQVLKIDRCFVQDLVTDSADAAIVRGTTGLAHSLGLAVVAEGVEDSDQRDALRGLGCDTLQGYYYSRPLPFDEIVQWIDTRAWGARRAA